MTVEQISTRLFHITGHRAEAMARGLVVFTERNEGKGSLGHSDANKILNEVRGKGRMSTPGPIRSLPAGNESYMLFLNIKPEYSELTAHSGETPDPNVMLRTAEMLDDYATYF